MKTILLVLLLLPGPLRAATDPLVAAFATCAGRFSAELEHAWLLQDPRSAQLDTGRAQFLSLLDATMPPDGQPDMLGLRIRAKVAHAALLGQATFARDAQRSAWAARRAKAEIDACAAYLLDS